MALKLSFFEAAFGPLKTAFSYIKDYWWTVAPFLLGFGSYWAWINLKRQEYISAMKWVTLEIKPPADVVKSPKMAENIFSALHSVYIKAATWKERFFKGKVQDWFSFEIVSVGGEMRFYVKAPEAYRNFIESQIFAQYSDAEIKESEDYINNLPEHLPNDEFDLFGTELIFTKPDAYPLKTYPEFEESPNAKETENKRTDPLSPLAEQISTLDQGEHIWVQLIVRGTSGDWVKKAQSEIDKMMGREAKVEADFLSKAVEGFSGLITSAIPSISAGEERKEEKKELTPGQLTPGQRVVLEAIEKKIAKLGFKSGIRFIYIAKKDSFHGSHISGVIGMFKQFYSNNLNTFRPNSLTITASRGWLPWLFPSDKGFRAKAEEFVRKRRIYSDYRNRSFIKQSVILNTEELATLWHLPGAGVKAPLFPRVESKKGQPPAGLPIK